ncbi:histone promoter control 2 [Drepanopeziza brunnea f. sp. 'multigermtubi' MB_m1]|uniref:Histone promoter control 2 n=1 Tax=Marssonina brunnea f. sp. multigermtubi (strain MB_m1) TaxID=1072389 RepID=K1X2X2_MARBU|nr:histone promoter control 2 [Drepanopeziza brunnea f. sp. 'multigermtubi' MB_m1]EKD15078.1 histone promoter control 2 [Drepanopeziza brunnea f. sp. 'multigermtubi' MB_m1]
MATTERRRTMDETGRAGGAGGGLSPNSASELSSPPRSSPDAGSPSHRIQDEKSNNHASHKVNNASIAVNPPQVQPQVPPQPQSQSQPQSQPQPQAGVLENPADQKPPRKKPGRKPGSTNKPKNNDSSATNTDTQAPKVRKPRKPKDPNAPPVQRRKRNAASDGAQQHLDIVFASEVGRQSPHPLQEAPPNFQVPVLASQNGKSEDIPRPAQSFFNAPAPHPSAHQQQQQQQQQQQPQQQQSQPPSQQQQQQPPQPQQPPPAPHPVQHHTMLRTSSSGQNYDPIRSNYDPVRETVVSHHPYSINSQGSPNHPHALNRASASPSISSLVDPPNQSLTSPSVATQSFFNQQQQQQQQQQARLHQHDSASGPPSPTVNRQAPAANVEPKISPNAQGPASFVSRKSDTMAPQQGPSTVSRKSGPLSTTNSSAAASPKPQKPKKTPAASAIEEVYPAPPPLPGSGLMGIGGGGAADGTEFRAPTVILTIPMNGEVNKYINFTRLAEEQYGWDALHPRLAAQRDRLARVAAAGAALERQGSNKDSGDEMSLDSEGEGDVSNVEMGGMSDGRTGTDGGKKVPKKRKMKEDEYDKDDGFVDDTELLWEEHAAATNDGFFVYSGPLVPEGDNPALEISTAPKRGRGRGSRGGRAAGGARGAAANKLLGSIPLGHNGLPIHGPGSRGGSTTRKPRITKADRARMEQEKLDREKMGGSMGSMPANYGNVPHVASAPSNLGSTPMVFNQ